MKKFTCLLLILLMLITQAFAATSPTIGPYCENLQGIELVYDDTLFNTEFDSEVIEQLESIFSGAEYEIFDCFLIAIESPYELTEWVFEKNFLPEKKIAMILRNENTYVLEGVAEDNFAIFDFTNIPSDIYEVYVLTEK